MNKQDEQYSPEVKSLIRGLKALEVELADKDDQKPKSLPDTSSE